MIDEIGKMELFSKPFIVHVRKVFNEYEGGILATIPIARGKALSLVEEITNRSDTKVIAVSFSARLTFGVPNIWSILACNRAILIEKATEVILDKTFSICHVNTELLPTLQL